ncbi:MAG: hypothetical protein ACO3A4_02175 [Silvanigrellaceae bacterium]
MRSISLFVGLMLTIGSSACLKRSGELVSETTFESLTSGKNAGFRILPQTAARDELRPRVVYRCNEVQCGEAFQPSNEERDMFIPCEAALGTSAQTPVMPYMRVLGEGAKRSLIVKEAHKKACETPASFEKLVAAPVPGESKIIQGAPTCRVFRRDKGTCEANASTGCRWVSHPSRNGDPVGGECIGTFRATNAPDADPNLQRNVQSLQGAKPVNGWSDLSAYRGKDGVAPGNPPNNLK